MLQFDRKTQHSTVPSKTKNFLALNKSLVKTKSKSEATKRKDKEPCLSKGKPQSNPSSGHASRKAGQHQSSEETVTISKDYLEQLLRQNYSAPVPPTSNAPSLPSTSKASKGPLEQHDAGPSPPTHVIVDHTEVPGLEYQAAGNRSKGTRAHPNKTTTTTNNKRRNEEVPVEPQPTSDIPHVSHVSPPHGGESYHRGTMNRPVHPAMKSSIDFGVGGGGGGRGVGWQQRPTNKVPYSNAGHDDGGKRRRREEAVATMPVNSKLQQNLTAASSQVQSSPRSSLDLFLSHKDENKMKDFLYREELRLQIEENKRLKEEERYKRELEERREAERVEKERQQLAWEFEKEKERQRQKEIEATQKLASLYEQRQLAKEAADKEKMKQQQLHRRHNEEHEGIAVASYQQENSNHPPSSLLYSSTDFDLRSPSMLQATSKGQQQLGGGGGGGGINKSPRHKAVQGIEGGVGRRQTLAAVQGTGSQISLHSTSSEEPSGAASNRHKDRAVTNNANANKMASGLVRESRVQRRQAIKKQMESKKSDSESEEKMRRQRPGGVRAGGQGGGGRAVGGKPSSNRPIANSIARSNKQVLQRSLKEHSHNRTVRLREPNAPVMLYSSPDIQERSYHQPPRSPPVPAVAKRLAQGQTGFVNDIHDLPGPDVTFSVLPVDQEELEPTNNAHNGIQPQIISSVQELPTITVPKSNRVLPSITSNYTSQATGVPPQNSVVNAVLPSIVGSSSQTGAQPNVLLNNNNPVLPSIPSSHNGVIASSNTLPQTFGTQFTALPSITGATSIPHVTVSSSMNHHEASPHIARAASCSPDIDQTSLMSSTGKQVLPPILEIRSREEKLFERDHVQSNSQQQMLNSLSKLKQNIASHTAIITNRVRDVL
ncbi:PREDICTED: uncharacterized protein LOC109581203 [Amphimedon queenslandica]|nr:PREDICTED: uncharacterized protein LOC109581203 [Amphimedon queenslandica]|eukprot:XP_019850647.1 PREDICTED: uncharacterized protein LOC109581203 [Amphimedon queenslandica]